MATTLEDAPQTLLRNGRTLQIFFKTMTTELIDVKQAATSGVEPAWISLVRRHVDGLRFGEVHIIVHDAAVVQVERTERTRFAGAAAKPSDRPLSAEVSRPKPSR